MASDEGSMKVDGAICVLVEGKKGYCTQRGQDKSTYVDVAVGNSLQLTWRFYIRSETTTSHNNPGTASAMTRPSIASPFPPG
jgi:hypothetical protein